MAKNLVAIGKFIDWVNGTAAAVTSGAVVIVAGLACVAQTDIAIGATGALAITDVYDVTKAAGTGVVFAQGANVYWNATLATAVATSGDGLYPLIGVCYEAAVTADAVVAVKLNSAPVTGQAPVLSGLVTWTGSGASLAEAVTGVLATDNVMAVIQSAPTQAAYLVSVAASGADEITFVLSAANTSDDAVIFYQVFR